ERGIGVSPNKEGSFHYISEAARLEYIPAVTKLGDYYYSGYFVDRNLEWAQGLYEKAAERGDSQALLNLGIMQEKGLLGGTGDCEDMYRRAAQMGNTNAQLLLGLKKTSESTRNEEIAKVARQGNLNALRLLNRSDALGGK
ncbi:unnamed protein product, partial [Sphagnum balticum]